tara:strand:- start:2357 stop:2740 length:384 start_codon:yes stop_codon:yes gene_type:complete
VAESQKNLVKKEIKSLKHEYDPHERSEIGDRLADAVTEKARLSDEKKSVTSRIGSKIAEQDAIINDCSEGLRSGFEFRPTNCEVTYFYKDGNVETIRVDTGEQVEFRDMRPDERQMELSKAPEKEKG